jgi:hypothetical protein
VWWDRVIPPGKQYDDVIEQALAGAKCVVVLWSPASAASKWVRIEAGEAFRSERLVPALIDSNTTLPLEFSRVQAADLSQWQASQASEPFEQFCAAIQEHVAATPKPKPKPKPAPAPSPAPPNPPTPPATGSGFSRKQLGWAGGAAAVVLGAWITAQNAPPQPMPLPYVVPAPAPEPLPALTPAPAPAPKLKPLVSDTPLPSPVELMDGGIDRDLKWRDHVLNFTGHLTWDGRSPQASLQARAVDSGNGRVVGDGRFVLQMQQVTQGRIVFLMSLVLQGDSHTAGQHVHGMGLIFDRLPGNGPANWRYVHNCTAPGRPDLCF